MWFRNIFNTDQRDQAGSTRAGARQNGSQLSAQTLRLLDRMILNTDPLFSRQSNGGRAGLMRKPAAEFREHRQYVLGDDVRNVDWKASARQEHIYIKQNIDPRAQLIYLLVDCSASMAWGDPPKSQTALALANALGYLALTHQDRLVILPVAGGPSAGSIRTLGPVSGKGQASMLSPYLRSLRFDGEVDVSRALLSLNQRRLSQGSLVLVISDLLGTEGLSAALAALPVPAWKVVFLHLLHPEELNPSIDGQFEMRDIETGQKKELPVTGKVIQLYRQRIDAWQDQLHQICLERRALYIQITSGGSISHEILPALQRARVVKQL